MNLEIKEDSTYTFTFERTVDNLTKGLTSATIAILSKGGATYQTATAMTVASNVATKSINFATDPTAGEYSLGRFWQAVIVATYADSTTETIVRFFDIVRYPFVNQVKDQDLIDENRYVAEGIQDFGGTASSGSDSTLVDLNRAESDDYWNGGKLFILPLVDTDKVTEHTVTDFVKSTGTLTFTPTRTAVTLEQYTLRRSYQAQINLAGKIVQEDLLAQTKLAYLCVDSTQLNRLIVYKCLERYFQPLREQENDKWDLQFKYYQGEYKKLFDSIPLTYDASDDGAIDDDEQTVNLAVINLSR